MLLMLNVPLVGWWVRILRIPVGILNPLIVLFICLGTYLVNNSVFDVWVMLLFGLLGVVLRKLEFPLAPVALIQIARRASPSLDDSLPVLLLAGAAELANW